MWLKNLPRLIYSKQNSLFEQATHGVLSEEFTTNKHHKQSRWYNNNKNERSTTFPAIANAIADQVGINKKADYTPAAGHPKTRIKTRLYFFFLIFQFSHYTE